MPAIDNPHSYAASINGQIKDLERQLKDLSVNRTFSPAGFHIGLTGLVVDGPTTLTGGISGNVSIGGTLGTGGTITAGGNVNAGAGFGFGVGSTGKGFDGAGNVSAANATVSGNESVGGDFNIVGDIYSPHGKATPVVSGYISAWFNSDGRLGCSTSARRFKQDIQPRAYDLEQIAKIQVVSYRLIEAVEEQGDAARVEIGVIAEDLIDAGLSEFVVFDEAGQPFTVAYERLALVAISAVQELTRRLANFESRLKLAGL